ncbi:NADH oxidoreductase [Serratia entomophila]|uniref:NADH oxidoreductase n=1 Tax=Serratia entomophila TaxID=42906 RepID=A0ABY5CYG3_9GAMM|nr:NADH oxidoreductase [Serratia entomophila]USV02496.1 NADH oxidoreductase [Serratia entomophila]CAI0825357.1 NADH oxidoreductase hcr [Serratia entomophila]CAI0836129.1 NADH oxidoreductase hcr [Serratia entomophila]CAI0862707.1 NADH oxidoreductase hcr [Serratia entomophila]CAI0887705.1 NADH oxidoreductase hcr [Serratia entomophila]
MTQPSPRCPNRMQVHSIQRETADVWTLNLICDFFYPYQPGQFALIGIRNDEETLRAYTLSSSPGQSRFLSISVRCLPNGVGSRWLTQEVQPGNTLWLSDAQGDFNCVRHPADSYLMLAAGCGVTPIVSMCRWLVANRPSCDIAVIFNVRTPADTLFAGQWHALCAAHPQLRLTLMAEQDLQPGYLGGRINGQVLRQVAPDIAERRVMTCGPAPYMDQVERLCLQLGVPAPRFHKERFHTPEAKAEPGEGLTLRAARPLREFRVPVGSTLLAAMEANALPVNAACRAGVCGACKTRILEGDYATTSNMTLTPAEIAQGYVLACSCQLRGDVTLA